VGASQKPVCGSSIGGKSGEEPADHGRAVCQDISVNASTSGGTSFQPAVNGRDTQDRVDFIPPGERATVYLSERRAVQNT
jgi:hypothetical protein